MFERFTERGRQVVVEAQLEARRQRHDAVYPDHLAAGLFLEGEGLAARVLESCGWTLESVRERMLRMYTRAEDAPTRQIPFDPSATKALECAFREALSLGHNWVGTEHVLLGICREGTTFVPSEVRKLRDETIRLLSGPRRSELRPARPEWEAVETRVRCRAGFSLYGANFHCQSDAGHDPADGHVEHGDGWTMRWDS